ncbi:MAG: hypothetical protein ACLTSZ_07930 [Lachnospiraceae bacterium]
MRKRRSRMRSGSLRDLKEPKWYVYDRNELPDNTGYGENAERMTNIAQVFPLVFFLVAALISLTTMTRMVEEERTQIRYDEGAWLREEGHRFQISEVCVLRDDGRQYIRCARRGKDIPVGYHK